MLSEDRILVVEDEPQFRALLCSFLESNGYPTHGVATSAEAEAVWRRHRPALAILDYSLPDGNAIELLLRLKSIDTLTPVFILTGRGTIELAVEAIKLGAEHFVTKPTNLRALLALIKESLEQTRSQQRQNRGPALPLGRNFNPFAGSSACIRQLEQLARRAAGTDSPVLIQGETGTGKGVLARWLHNHGPRAAGPFIDLNCGGLSHEFLETELFGHEKGAFTGAVRSKSGLLEIAHQGTVFLDEIEDVDLSVQPKLLKVLEEKTFRHLGDVRDRRVDIRLIAAAHDLSEPLRRKAFRADLYFRISTIQMVTPPLRQRAEDIPLLARHILDSLGREGGGPEVDITPRALAKLQAYHWPGNIRELRNVLERALMLSTQAALSENDLQFEAGSEPLPLPSSQLSHTAEIKTLEEMEQHYIAEVLFLEGGRVEAAAKRLGVPRSSLYQKLKHYGIAGFSSAKLY
jgi:DNA-binding NtrC family response regulator